MNFLTEHAATIVILFVLLCAITYVSYLMYTQQTHKLQKWLLLAVSIAEQELKSGTGKLKLEFVYDMFKARFSWLHLVMPRSTFERLVDIALDEMRHLLETNYDVATVIKGESTIFGVGDTL